MSRRIKALVCGNAMAFAVIAAVVLLAATPDANATGGTIVSPDPVGNTGLFTSLELDATGNPVVSYFELPNTLKVFRCGDPTCSAGNSIFAYQPDGFLATESSSLVLDATGRPLVVFAVDPGPSEDLEIQLLRCGTPTCSVGNTVSTIALAGDLFGNSPSIVLDPAGKPVVAYTFFDGVLGGLRVLHCGAPDCSSSNTSNVAAIDSASPSLVLDSSGNPVVAYERSEGQIDITRCADPACSSISVQQVGYGLLPSLALDSLGEPVTAYGTWPGITLLHCGDQLCGSGKSSSQLESNFVRQNSLRLDPVGNPVISYYDDDGGDLKVLHCNDVNCVGSPESFATVDSAGNVGEYSSLRLDASGNPVVAYYDRTHGDLRILHCADVNCSNVKLTPTPKPTSTPPVAGALDFSIAVDTDGNGTDDCSTKTAEINCRLSPGSTFFIRFYLNGLGSLSAYLGYQGILDFFGVTGSGTVDMSYWPQCDFPVSAFDPYPPSSFIAFGCAAFERSSTYVGLMATVAASCSVSGQVSIRHGQLGSYLIDSSVNERPEAPSGSESLQINCNSTPTPEPPTPTPTSTATPTSAAVGGVAVDAMSGSPDGLLIAFAVFAGGLVVLFGGAAVARARAR